MTEMRVARRAFLTKAGQTLAALPLLAALPASLRAQGINQDNDQTGDGTGKKHRKGASAQMTGGPKVHLNVRDLGATGDGKTKDTDAIQETLDRCSVLGGGEVLVPAGDYLTGALRIHSNTTLRIDEGASLLGSPDMADYPLTQVRWEGHWIKGYIGFISAMDAENIALVGKGKIIASDAIKGRVDRTTHYRLPALLEFVSCKNVRVEDLYTLQTGMWSTHPVYCENVSFHNVTFHSGADGIDVDSCVHVTIDGCDFDTADDCISLKSGRGAEGNTIARPTVDVHISNCTFRDKNFACIGIGSETSAGVRDVHVDHCKFLSARSHAVYIKSRPGRGAYVEDIYMNDLEVSCVRQGFLRINNLNSGKQDEYSVGGDAGIPEFKNFRFNNIRVTDVPQLVQGVEIHPRKPLVGFSLTNVTGTCAKGIFLANMKDVTLKNINVTGFTGPLLSTYNVTGKGLAGAAPLEPTKEPPPVETKPYTLQ